IILIISWLAGWLNDGVLLVGQILGMIFGGLVLIIGGVLDDKYNLKPWQSFLFPVIAAIIAVAFGIVIKYITNPLIAGTGPFGRSLFYFDWVNLKIISFSALFSFLWILGMIYTTKFLDGLDGLVTGIGAIGAMILFIVSLFWNEPMSAMSVLCLIFAGSLAGFLVFNFHPAKIFLGEAGATFVGFMLGSLSIISGGKLATALLIMGIPILDIIWVVFRRIFSGQHIYTADRKHLHFRLLDVGLSHRQTVLLLYLLTLIFGASSIFLQSKDKILALGVLIFVMVLLGSALVVVYRKRIMNYEL
ncbi:undecaprenyl/decaprenyl-phosphate alpha-N-acetylglucosaminyl 1-phosphate transferase, partial [Patescibacteria group bacterium]|nr:undecaprenyl/decaprenyl-phosphate alpha-N-acetylglucosaminyl 1-phosphate transferase [Patescibacteria group bacterium]